MLFLWIFLWTIAGIVIISDPKSEKTRWGSAVAFFSGIGGLVVVVDNQIRYFFSANWSYIIDIYVSVLNSLSYYISPYAFIIFSLVFSGAIDLKLKKYRNQIKLILFVPVLLMYILFPISRDFNPSYHILCLWVAPYVLTGNFILIYYCFKTQNPKIRKQIILTTLITSPPTMFSLITNYLSSIFDIYNVWQYNTWIIAGVFILFIIISVKFGAFNIRVRLEKNRFANLESIIDNISEGFVVVDENKYIIEMNQSFVRYFGNLCIGENFEKAISFNDTLLPACERLTEATNKCIGDEQPLSLEDLIYLEDQGKSFSVDITPVYEKKKFVGAVILFRDITELKNNIFLLEKNQNQIIENERLSSLGQLIGGISHNLRTPLLASSGGIDIISDITKKMQSEIEAANIPEEEKMQHMEKVLDMLKWEDQIKNYLSYMNNVITTIKGQVTQNADSEDKYFSVNELVNGIDILMKHEFKKASVNFKYSIDVDDVNVPGNINYLLQVMDNIIINAIDSYDDRKGAIVELIIKYKSTDKIDIVIKDYGKGMSEAIQSKLFRQMITTKGKNGTGLGLYISKSIITSKFGGDIEFESSVGKGSAFTIRLPIEENSNN